MKHNRRLGGLYALLFCLALGGSVSAGQEAEEESGHPENAPVSGYFDLRYQYRGSEDYLDRDLVQSVSLDFGEEGVSLVSGHLHAQGYADLDLDTAAEDGAVFRDTYNDKVDARLFLAYLDVNSQAPPGLFRAGRQEIYQSPVFVHFDGIRLEAGERPGIKLKAGAYGGKPVRDIYETDTDNDGALAGAYLESRPWRGGRAHLHWTYLHEEYDDVEVEDNYYSLSLSQALYQRLRFRAVYSRVNDLNRDLTISGSLAVPESEFALRVSYYELLEKQEFTGVDLDYYYSALFNYQPYRQGGIWLHQGFNRVAAIDAGADFRELTGSEDETAYNHEFAHYFAVLSLMPYEGLTLSASGDRFDARDDSLDTTAYGGDVTYRHDKKFRVSVGSYYALYEYDYLLDDEQTDVRNYYARLRWRPLDNFRLDVGYEYEDTEEADYTTLKLKAAVYF